MARIVVADDEQQWRDWLVEILGNAGHSVDTCKDGSCVLEQITEQRPDLVVLDINMSPGGRDILLSLRRLKPDLPIVIYTAYAAFKDHPAFALADAFLEKNFDMNELVHVISRLLHGGIDGGNTVLEPLIEP